MSILDISDNTSALAELKKKEEELVERTDPRKGEFSYSSVSLGNCPRKFLLSKLWGVKSTYPRFPLLYGSAIHKAVEYFYNNLHSETMSFEEVQIGAIQEFTNDWSSYGVEGDAKRNLEGGILTIGRYCDRYRHEDIMYEKEDVEGAQWLPMPNGTMFQMKIDRVQRDGSMVGVVDTKTSSMALTDWYFRQYENHFQTSLYYNGMESILGECDYVMIDAILVPHPKKGSRSEAFARRTFYRTELQIEEAVRTYCKMSDYLLAGVDKTPGEQLDHYYCNPERCADYGGCEYLQICKHGMDHPCVGTDFTVPPHLQTESSEDDSSHSEEG